MRVHRNCCGLDVHKETIAACLISESEDGTSSRLKRIFGTMTQRLRELAQWLAEAKVTAVAMEATGIYWVPVWNVLEQSGFELLLINPEHYKAVRGKKTDLKDGERIAELLQDGRLAGSYLPAVAIRVLRDLTRYRTKLVQYQSSIANRIQRLLVDALTQLFRYEELQVCTPARLIFLNVCAYPQYFRRAALHCCTCGVTQFCDTDVVKL